MHSLAAATRSNSITKFRKTHARTRACAKTHIHGRQWLPGRYVRSTCICEGAHTCQTSILTAVATFYSLLFLGTPMDRQQTEGAARAATEQQGGRYPLPSASEQRKQVNLARRRLRALTYNSHVCASTNSGVDRGGVGVVVVVVGEIRMRLLC